MKFLNQSNEAHSYNKFGQPLVSSTTIWDGSGWGIGDNAARTMYYYEATLAAPGNIALQAQLKAWPIPANTELNIEAGKADIDLSTAVAIVRDMQGRQAGVQLVSQNQSGLRIAVAGLPDGMYWLMMRDARGKQATLKVAIVH